MSAVHERILLELQCLLEQRGNTVAAEEVEKSSGIPTNRMLLRRDLASKSSHLLSNLISSVDRCSTLACKVVMSSVQEESDV